MKAFFTWFNLFGCAFIAIMFIRSLSNGTIAPEDLLDASAGNCAGFILFMLLGAISGSLSFLADTCARDDAAYSGESF